MARKKRRGRPKGSSSSKKKTGRKKRKSPKSNRIPLPILKRRLQKLAKIVQQRS